MTKDDALKQINRSGYPFQLRVEREVEASRNDHGWSVASREHPWTNPNAGSSGFIDIVLKSDPLPACRLVLECKRMKPDDERQLNWQFLIPEEEPTPIALASCFEVEGRFQTGVNDATWNEARMWDNVHLSPKSLQAEFCILPADEPRRTPILESLAADVLESVEGLAQEELSIARSRSGYKDVQLFIFPAIVTNATLSVCRFDPGRVRIEDGTLDVANSKLETVPFIRFRKSLATGFPDRQMNDLKDAAKARERTVFVVTAAHIDDFLYGWKFRPHGGVKFAIDSHW